mgnify:CR=1 FL=1
MVVKKDNLYKEVSKLFKRFEEVEKEIGNYTKPEGCRIFKRERYWEIWKPEEKIPFGKKREILIVSSIDDFVTDKSKVLELLDELEKIHNKVYSISEQLGKEGVKIYRDFLFHYYRPYMLY